MYYSLREEREKSYSSIHPSIHLQRRLLTNTHVHTHMSLARNFCVNKSMLWLLTVWCCPLDTIKCDQMQLNAFQCVDVNCVDHWWSIILAKRKVIKERVVFDLHRTSCVQRQNLYNIPLLDGGFVRKICDTCACSTLAVRYEYLFRRFSFDQFYVINYVL